MRIMLERKNLGGRREKGRSGNQAERAEALAVVATYMLHGWPRDCAVLTPLGLLFPWSVVSLLAPFPGLTVLKWSLPKLVGGTVLYPNVLGSNYLEATICTFCNF